MSTVYQDLHQAGRSMGQSAAKFIPPDSKILMTVHSQGISTLEDRMRGAQDALEKKWITWKIVVTGIHPAKAVQATTKPLKANPQVKVVLGTGQVDTEAVGLAMEQLKGLRGCDAHTTHMPTPGDETGLRRLGVNLTSEPKFATRDLFTG